MKVGVHQPNYLPWCGYFAKLKACDIFIILDDAQMPNGRSYLSRAKIRFGSEDRWLSLPTSVHGQPRINEVEFADSAWAAKHLATLRHTYGKAPFAAEVLPLIEPVYQSPGTHLSAFNLRLLRAVIDYLGLSVDIRLSSSLQVQSTSDDRLIELVRQVGGSEYLSGAGGTNYQDPAKFEAAAIRLDVRTYSPVAYGTDRFPFRPGLSIIDALFVRGRQTIDLLRYQ